MTAAGKLHKAMRVVVRRCRERRITVHPQKTVATVFAKGHVREKPALVVDGVRVTPPQPTMKMLGVILDARLRWLPHAAYVEARAKRRAGELARICGRSWGLPLTLPYSRTRHGFALLSSMPSVIWTAPDLPGVTAAVVLGKKD